MKRCRLCRRDLPPDRFHVDRSRLDGRAYVCISCRLSDHEGPSRRQRRLMREIGLAWCSGCEAWGAYEAIGRGGKCRKHENAATRRRYATDSAYRSERRQHAHARKRGVAPIPAEAQADMLDQFNGRCAYCPRPAKTWDHVVPIARGGRTTPGNVVPCCVSCNSRKRDREPEAWIESCGDALHPALLERLDLADSGLYG